MTTRIGSVDLRPDIFYRAAIILIGALLFLGPLLHPLKLVRISVLIPSLNFYVGFPLVITLLFFSWLILLLRRESTIDFLEALLIFLIFWGIIWTVWYGGTVWDIGGNLSRLLFAFLLYHLTRQYRHFWTLNLTIRFAWLGFLGILGGLFLLYSLGVFGPLPVYVGLSSEFSLLMLSVALAGRIRNRWTVLALVVIAVIVSGKRGVILAVPFMIAAYLIFFGGHSKRVGYRLFYTMILGGALIGFLLALYYLGILSAFPEQLTGRYAVIGALEMDQQNLRVITAARNLEVLAVLDEWRREPIKFWLGAGFGASFEILGPDGYIPKSTVHITPIALTFIYGFPLGGLLLIVIFWRILKALNRGLEGNDLLSRIWAVVALGIFIVSMSSFVLLQNYLMWIALALMANSQLTYNHNR